MRSPVSDSPFAPKSLNFKMTQTGNVLITNLGKESNSTPKPKPPSQPTDTGMADLYLSSKLLTRVRLREMMLNHASTWSYLETGRCSSDHVSELRCNS